MVVFSGRLDGLHFPAPPPPGVGVLVLAYRALHAIRQFVARDQLVPTPSPTDPTPGVLVGGAEAALMLPVRMAR